MHTQATAMASADTKRRVLTEAMSAITRITGTTMGTTAKAAAMANTVTKP
jgi:hypothetical protein